MEKDNSIIIGEIVEAQVSPETLKAINTLRTAKVPKEHIKKHPGKGGKTFSFVPHTIATDTMNAALGMSWDWQILDYKLFEDDSAVARGQLTINFIDKSGNYRQRVITEVGGVDAKGEKPVKAYQILSAASRALLRCMLRAFGYGRELYPDDEGDFTPQQAWVILEQYAKTKKVSKDELVASLKERKITKETLVDRFEEAYALIQEIVAKKSGTAIPSL